VVVSPPLRKMKRSRTESKRHIAGGASRSRSNQRPTVTKRLDRLETMSADVRERLTTLETRVTATQAQLDHLKAK
jgi:hypothetical protein